jgi:hypothetical protein
LVEQRLVPLTDGMRLGEAAEAAVAFPGADLVLQVVDGRLRVRGHDLGCGDLLTMDLGPVEVSLEVLDAASPWERLARRAGQAVGFPGTWPDPRLLVATLAVALAVACAEAWSDFVTRDPRATEGVAHLLEALASLLPR